MKVAARIVSFGVLALCLSPLAAHAQPRSSARGTAGRAVMVVGSPVIQRVTDSRGVSTLLRRGDRLVAGDILRTRSGGRVRLLMTDTSVIDLGPEAELQVKDYTVTKTRRKVGLRLVTGRLWARVSSWFGGSDNEYEVATPTAVAGVRGTSFAVLLDSGGGTKVNVAGGNVVLSTPEGQQLGELKAFQQGAVGPGGRGFTIQPLTVAELKRLEQTTRPPPRLTRDGTRGRLAAANQVLSQEFKSSVPPAVRLRAILSDESAPPYDLDPAQSATITTVRGRVVVEE